jgi:hypothetical protein
MQSLLADPTLIIAATAALVAAVIAWNRPFYVLAALVLLIPFRDFVTRWLNAHTQLPIDQVIGIGRWWSGVVVALLIVSVSRWLIKNARARQFPKPRPLDLAFATVLLLAVLAAVSSPNRTAALISLRGYLQTIPIYLVARLVVPSQRDLRTFICLWLLVGLIMSAFGIIQALTWDDATYRAEEYTRLDGQLVVPEVGIRGEIYLRPASTVSGPNELGVDMVVVITIVLFGLLASTRIRSVLLFALALFFGVGLVATASRSAVLALGAAVVVTLMLRRHEIGNWLSGFEARTRSAFVIVSGLAFAIAILLFSLTRLGALLADTVRKLPNEYHFVDITEAIEFLSENPQGVGMGLVRPKAALDFLALENVYHVEGSLFQIAVEMGIWGLLAWLIFFTIAMFVIAQNRSMLSQKPLRILSGSAVAGWTSALVAFTILPLMQSVSLMVWLWFLLGIGVNTPGIERSWRQEHS